MRLVKCFLEAMSFRSVLSTWKCYPAVCHPDKWSTPNDWCFLII